MFVLRLLSTDRLMVILTKEVSIALLADYEEAFGRSV